MALTEDFRKFLDQPHVARLAVIDDEGYPHVVPIWYALDGYANAETAFANGDSYRAPHGDATPPFDFDLIFFSGRRARKIGHVQANTKGAVSIGGDPWGTEGYLLKGEFTLEDDPSNRWMSLITHRYVPKERADQL